MNLEPNQLEALNHALTKLTIPEGYEGKSVRSIKQDEVDVWVFRYEKANGENNGLGGEHYSFTVTQDKHKIIGVMWVDQRFKKGQPLPSHEETREIVEKYLEKVEPGLLDRSENTWIRPEDSSITINGKEMTLTGVRYKLFMRGDSKWGWIIVGPDGNIMSFEQDMIWMGGRISEMWLHDSWVIKGADNNKMKSYIKNLLRKF